jgi:hypothetical protein
MEGERVGSAVGPSRRRDLPQLTRSRAPYSRDPRFGNTHSEIVPAEGHSGASPQANQRVTLRPSGLLRAVAWAVTPLKEYLTKVKGVLGLATNEMHGLGPFA